jgi:hypothetical protein
MARSAVAYSSFSAIDARDMLALVGDLRRAAEARLCCGGLVTCCSEPVDSDAEWVETLASLRHRGVAAVVAILTDPLRDAPTERRARLIVSADESGFARQCELEKSVVDAARAARRRRGCAARAIRPMLKAAM